MRWPPDGGKKTAAAAHAARTLNANPKEGTGGPVSEVQRKYTDGGCLSTTFDLAEGQAGRIKALTTARRAMSSSARGASRSGYSRVTSSRQRNRARWRAIICTARCRWVYS